MVRRLAFACVCLAAALSPGPRDNAAYAQVPPAYLSGWLTVVWPDAQPGEPRAASPDRPVFTLHTDDGQRWRIEPQAGQPSPDFRLSGRRVTATVVDRVARPGAAGGREAAGGGGTARVSSLRPAIPDGVAGALVEAAVTEAAAVTGSQRWVTIACKFADVAAEPKSLSFFSGMYSSSYPGLDHYWRELSFGAINVQGSTAHGWFVLPRTRPEYLTIHSAGGVDEYLDALASDCTAAAEPSVDFSTVKGINLMFNDQLDGYAWGGTTYLSLDGIAKSWRVTWEPPWAYGDISVIEHEMGHGFGWPHSSGTHGQTYDNAWDVMSEDRYNCAAGSAARHATYGCTGQHTIGYHKDLAGWVPSVRRFALPPGSSPTAITLEPLAGLPTGGLGSLPAGSHLIAMVQTGSTSTAPCYSVEVRKRSGYDAKLYGDGVIIHEVVPGRSDSRPAHLMDADTTNQETADAGALWTVGETFSDVASGISIRVDSATATGYVVTLSSSGVNVGPPTVTSVSPTTGGTAGGTVVTVAGGGFTADATVYFGGTPSTSVAVTSATSLTAVAPAHAAGPVAVSVTTSRGTSSTGASGFTYIAPPTITSLSPTLGSTAGGTTVTINGSGFVAGGTAVSIGGAAVTANVSSTTRLTAVTPAHPAGVVAVSVTTRGGTASLDAAFTYTAPQPTPTITGVAPSSGPTTGGTAITIQGSGFVASGTTVSIGGIAAASVNVLDSTRLTAVTPARAAGAATVTVTTDRGTSSPGVTYTYVNPVPAITAITPGTGAAYSSTPVVITGSNFVAGLTTVTFGSTAAASVIVSGPTSVSCATPQLAPGPVTVTVANGTATATSTFTYLGTPTLSSVTPASGPVTGGALVSIAGTNFVPGMSVSFDGVPATSVSVASQTQVTAVTPAHAAGAVPVRVSSGAGSMTTTPGYTYRAAPTVTRVSPSSGTTAGGTDITVTGTEFVPGGTVVTVGGLAAANVVVTSMTQLTAVTPAGIAGAATVSATTTGGTGSLAGGFSYVPSATTPTVTSVSPASGPAAGGTRLAIAGTNFSAGQTTVTVGGVPATDVSVESPTLVRATTPEGTDGSYADVTVATTAGRARGGAAYWYGSAPTVSTAALRRAGTGWQVTLTGDGFYPGVLSVLVGTAPALDVLVVDRWHLVAVAPSDMVGERGVTVTSPAGTATTTVQFPGTSTAYLAEGATGPFFDLDIAIANPHPSPVTANVTFLRSAGAPISRSYGLPALSRVTIAADRVPGLDVGQVSVSTVVESTAPLVVERTMFWSQDRYYGGHGGSAVEGASRTWYFAEGFQGFFDTYLLLANAGESPATVTVRFLRESEPPFVTTVAVPANARQTVYTGLYPELINRSFAIVVDSDVPIIAERAMYFGAFPFWKGGHESSGVPAPALRWSLAEGATGSYFDTYVLVANPDSEAATVTFRFLLSGANEGQTYTKVVEVPGMSRFTLNPETLALSDGFTKLADTAVSTVVTSTRPIVVERAMYWVDRTGSWTEAHNSFGLTEDATRWGLAEGRVGGPHGFQTYILLSNASATDAVVKLTYLREAGAPLEQTVTVAAASRYNVHVNSAVPGLASGERFGVLLESQPVAGAPAGVPIAVERAMYWDSADGPWAGGTDATGVKLP